MMEDIRAEKVNCIIVKDLSRFGRDYIQTGKYLLQILPSLGVRFIAINDNIDTLAPVVKQIFQWVLEGVSLEKIALQLNEANILTLSFYERKRGIIRKESSLGQGYWNTFTIIHIIENETYTGDMVQGKSVTIQHKQIKTDKKDWIVVKNTHEAIISKEIFEKVQQCRMQKAKKSKSQNKIPYTENVLKGKIYCQYCGKNLNRGREITKTKGEIYHFFCITNWRIKKGNCEGVRINERKLFQNILFIFYEKRNLFFEKEQFLKNQIQSMQKNVTLWKEQQTALEIQMNEKRLYLQTLYESLINRAITKTEYKELRENYQNEIENLLSEITCLEEIQQNACQKIENILNLQENFGATQNSEMTKEFSEQFIKRVEISPDNTVTIIFCFDELLNEIEVNDIA